MLLHNKVQAEGQEQELANELSKELEVHTGTMKVPSEKAWALALNKRQLLAENDFGKLLNGVVADGQTLHIVFLLTYGTESVRVLLEWKLWNESRGVYSSQRRRDNVLVDTQTIEYNIYSHSGNGSSCRRGVARHRGT